MFLYYSLVSSSHSTKALVVVTLALNRQLKRLNRLESSWIVSLSVQLPLSSNQQYSRIPSNRIRIFLPNLHVLKGESHNNGTAIPSYRNWGICTGRVLDAPVCSGRTIRAKPDVIGNFAYYSRLAERPACSVRRLSAARTFSPSDSGRNAGNRHFARTLRAEYALQCIQWHILCAGVRSVRKNYFSMIKF